MVNEPLFRALSRMYDVQVVDEDQVGDYVRKQEVGRNGQPYVRYEVPPGGHRGERYRMNCPFCSDTRQRFYVGYLFGMMDPELQRRNYGNTVCFNENCQSDFNNLRNLWEDIELAGIGEYELASRNFSDDWGKDDRPLPVMGEIGRPGICIPLRDILPGTADYRAVEYLRDERGFDIDILGQYYGVEYLRQSYTYGSLSGRIWTPFYRNGVLIAWTARAVDGLCQSDIRHWHSEGGLGGLLYGLGGALRCRVMCMVEGPADKWAVGRPGVAILSKVFGQQKRQRMVEGLVGSSVELVVVLLDPAQNEKELHRPHQIEVATATLRRYWNGIVLPVYLPLDLDPGSSPREFLPSYLQTVLTLYGYSELGAVLARDVSTSTATWR